MEEDEDYIELHKQNTKLVNDFINSNNIKSFKQLLNARTIPREKKCFFQSPLHIRPTDLLRKYKLQQQSARQHLHPKPSYSPSYQPYFHTSSNTELTNLNINRYHFIEDPDTKDKCMKGNYKWGTQKFNIIKFNLAKRKGIPFHQFQMPKVQNDNIIRKSTIDHNGNILTKIHTAVTLPKI
jgi:hypothetical protein